MTEGLCSRCGRLYYLEPLGDRALCCICERDERLAAQHGPGWRDSIRAQARGEK